MIKLSQNENAFGTPPLALKAIAEHGQEVFRYPDEHHEDLIEKLADKHNVKPENIIVSAGSVALLDMSIMSFVGSGENVVTVEVTWVGYKIIAKIKKRECRLAKLVDNAISLENILSLCDDKTRLVLLANPNNPTSTMISHDELKEFMRQIPPDVYVVSDEAYAEYITAYDYPDTLELQKTYPNLLIFHTFSKIYGLAGLRIGYAVTHPDVIKSLMPYKMPFSIPNLAAVAASAALDDTDYVEKCAAINAEERDFLYTELSGMGFDITVPHGNFVFIDFSTAEEREKIDNHLINEGIEVRPLGPFGSETALRITVGRPEENRVLVGCLKGMRL